MSTLNSLEELYGVKHITMPTAPNSTTAMTLEEYKQILKSRYTLETLIEKLYYQKGGSLVGL